MSNMHIQMTTAKDPRYSATRLIIEAAVVLTA